MPPHRARVRQPRVLTIAVVLVGLAAVAGLPSTLAHEGADMATRLTIEAREGSECPEGEIYCFAVTHGNLSDLEADTTVRLTFVNEGTQIHNVAVTRLRDADPDHRDTPMEGLFAGTDEEVPANASETFFFHVPADADGVYFWCHVVGHETAGMWLEAPFEGHAGQDDDVPSTPGVGAALAVAALGLVAAGLARRSGRR